MKRRFSFSVFILFGTLLTVSASAQTLGRRAVNLDSPSVPTPSPSPTPSRAPIPQAKPTGIAPQIGVGTPILPPHDNVVNPTSPVTPTNPNVVQQHPKPKPKPTPKPQAGEETVDLNNLGDVVTESAAPPKNSNYHAAHGQQAHGYGPSGGGASSAPNFKVFFDFNVVSRPGITPFTFDNYHSLLLFELSPTPEIQFSFDVNPAPHYYELDYQMTERLQLRVGKIWIPFDDMSPHNIFGGRVNVSRLSPGAAFLPDLWTDLGIGMKYRILDSSSIQLDAHAYVVNGFRSGGTDLLHPSTGTEAYPSFSDLPTAPDNNADKAIGGRLNTLLFNRLGLGASFYTCRWSSQTQTPFRLNIYGFDSQFRLQSTEFRAGYASMSVQIPGDTFNRGGLYGEIGQKLGEKQEWKVLARGGKIQLDDRVIDVTDQTIVGATVLYKPGMIQYSIEYSRDLQKMDRKKNYDYYAGRVVIAF